MLDLAARDVHPHDTLVVYPLIQQDPLYRVGIASLQEDDRVVHPHESRKAEGLQRRGPVRDVHESQEWERRRRPRMDPLDCTLGRFHELRQGVGLPGAQGQGVGEPLGIGGEVVCLPPAHPGPHYRVNVQGDHVEELR